MESLLYKEQDPDLHVDKKRDRRSCINVMGVMGICYPELKLSIPLRYLWWSPPPPLKIEDCNYSVLPRYCFSFFLASPYNVARFLYSSVCKAGFFWGAFFIPSSPCNVMHVILGGLLRCESRAF
jgi:hypothetical protein